MGAGLRNVTRNYNSLSQIPALRHFSSQHLNIIMASLVLPLDIINQLLPRDDIVYKQC